MGFEREGFNILSKEEKEMLNKIFEEGFQKIERLLKNSTVLKLQLRMHEKKKGKKYSIHISKLQAFHGDVPVP